jgi:hypothetical protein
MEAVHYSEISVDKIFSGYQLCQLIKNYCTLLQAGLGSTANNISGG